MNYRPEGVTDWSVEIMRLRAAGSLHQCSAGFPLPDDDCERCGATEDEPCGWTEDGENYGNDAGETAGEKR